ncbi:c-type cytochrome [Lutibaculum baratangense]|uniref:Cytochrome c family protein n=1 Tax=Lutibaculum baratangense AMV1 TaxID=631454 RepID=V4RNA0_9HYPH|nr:cytochrome c [Lutibaculum baratangense]ESR27461.1 Cytochrome c family protein [Lutibaculum baratangense AMV1]
MNIRDNLPKYAVLAFLALGTGLFVWRSLAPGDAPDARVAVTVPDELSPVAMEGKAVFDENCADCHGANAAGTEQGPPLVHDIYNPGHHANMAFVLAASQGVRAHHWRFGNMPPQPGVTQTEVEKVVQYVRELQQANGITYRPHNM